MCEQSSGFGLVVSFSGLPFGDSPEHAFVHGVEFGQLWQRMRSGTDSEISGTFHTANREVIERACAAEGWTIEVKLTDYAEWITATLSKTAKTRTNPRGLRVV